MPFLIYAEWLFYILCGSGGVLMYTGVNVYAHWLVSYVDRTLMIGALVGVEYIPMLQCPAFFCLRGSGIQYFYTEDMKVCYTDTCDCQIYSR